MGAAIHPPALLTRDSILQTIPRHGRCRKYSKALSWANDDSPSRAVSAAWGDHFSLATLLTQALYFYHSLSMRRPRVHRRWGPHLSTYHLVLQVSQFSQVPFSPCCCMWRHNNTCSACVFIEEGIFFLHWLTRLAESFLSMNTIFLF